MMRGIIPGVGGAFAGLSAFLLRSRSGAPTTFRFRAAGAHLVLLELDRRKHERDLVLVCSARLIPPHFL
jgi:hypothetical protein